MGGFYQGKGGKGGAAGDASSAAAPAGATIPSSLIRKLQALDYPEVSSASLDGQAYCKIVLFLEEEKIRLYEKIDRGPLRSFTKAWYEAATNYAKELGVPYEGLSEKDFPAKLRMLNGLTNIAVHDIYRDKMEADELMDACPPQRAATGEKQRLGQLIPPLNQLMEFFSLPTLEPNALDADVLAALKCVQVRVDPKEAEEVKLDLNSLPLGMEVSNPEMRRAVAVLRLLHGWDLQQLQVNINTVINELQQLTANPQTDSRLGRVGR
eukprot:TRINITY_DN4957_c0_g1_i1.p1 TRINITY_DN4957_c0_g1~~TRINITY_DN4957_c0_g1_i1.p1  ORF type:complete len:266 (+),score=68.37 TRINITY_DN4957_c0_g1_i1:75-872(+)